MPRSKTVDVAHSVMTDHRIQRTPVGRTGVPPTKQQLEAFLGTSDDRGLGLAYAELGDVRAREYLLRAKPVDSAVLVRLAAMEQNPKPAMEKYEAILREDPANTVALVNLGALYAQSRRLDDTAALWKRALGVNPAIEGAALNLARIPPPAEARRILGRYLQFNPGSTAARAALDTLR